MTGDDADFPFAHWIDHLWCDIHGIYLRGWAHAYERRVRAVALRSGARRVSTSDFVARPDVASHYGAYGYTLHCGFALYLPCPPFEPAWLDIETDDGVRTLALTVPEHLTGPETPPPRPPRAIDPFIAEMKARRGRVLEIGARVVGPLSVPRAAEFEPECTYHGCDIHAAPGIDIVADAHSLTVATGRAAFDGIFSVAVLEHLAAPWRVAAEVNRALKPGGLTFHVTPHSYPLHETPNDFWRFSDEALKMLFGPATGFEVIATGFREPVFMAPDPTWRHLQAMTMTGIAGYANANILARKIADLPDGALDLAGSADLTARSQAYPNPVRTERG